MHNSTAFHHQEQQSMTVSLTQDTRVQQAHEKSEHVWIFSKKCFVKFTQHGYSCVFDNVVEHRIEEPTPSPSHGCRTW